MTKWWPSIHWQYHAWIDYEDVTGRHAAEPDLFGITPDGSVLLLEIKLTGGTYGRDQCLNLYAPLLAHLFARPIRSLQVCKSLTPQTPGPFLTLDEMLESDVEYATWQWLGR